MFMGAFIVCAAAFVKSFLEAFWLFRDHGFHGCHANLRGTRIVTTGAVVTETFYFLLDVRDGADSLASFLDVSGTRSARCV
jgi:hypothetical protein